MVWAGISLEARTDLYIIPRRSSTAVRYIDEILQDFVVPYVDFIGDNFIQMHDNARPHTARITQQFDEDIDVLQWPVLLGRRIRSCFPISSTLNELQHALLEKWYLIPHLILGMPRRTQPIIRAHGGNTRY
nr:unnamed protein product [Callosobruchus chinensis]